MRISYSSTLFLAILCLFTLSMVSLYGQSNYSVAFSDQFLSISPFKSPPSEEKGMVRMVISHGHCGLPLTAQLSKSSIRNDQGELKDLSIDFEVNAHSIIANVDQEQDWTRSVHSPEAFDVQEYPTFHFVCHQSQPFDQHKFQLSGSITIKGHTEPATLFATPVYSTRAGSRYLQKFQLEGKVDLNDFGFTGKTGGGVNATTRIMSISLEVEPDGC